MNEHDVHLNDTSMSSSDYGEFSHACIHASMAQNDVWLKKYDINSWPRWDYSMQDATLIFSGAGKPDLVFDMEVVGSTTDESWEWSWGNVTLPEPCRQCMKQVYDFGVVMSGAGMLDKVKALAPDGVDHIVEVAFGANVETDVELLMAGGSIATYATNDPKAPLPFWEMVFKNVRLYCLGSDDFPAEVKQQAAVDINAALAAGWKGFAIAEEVPLAEIARAQELVEKPEKPGRIVVVV